MVVVIDREKTDRAVLDTVETERVEEFPLPVAEDWTDDLPAARTMCADIDRHMAFESKLQGRDLSARTLCPEQKVSLVSDIVNQIN